MQLNSNEYVQRSVAQWSESIARYQQSGLGSREFCAAEDLVPRTFEKWERRLRRKEGTKGQFGEVPTPQAVSGAWAVEWNSRTASASGYEGKAMWFTPEVRRILAYSKPVDLRKSIDGLVGLVKSVLEEDPLSGSLFVFVNRRGNLVKLVSWDRTGWCLFAKR